MPISYSFEVVGQLLKVYTQGSDENLHEVENYARKILELSIKNECTKILCDERKLEYSLSVLDTYTLAENASIEARMVKKIAIICKKKYLVDGKLFETVSLNRGLTVLVTADINQAIEWLK